MNQDAPTKAVTPSGELAKDTDNLKATLALATDAYRDRAKLIASLQAMIHDKQAEFRVLKREHAAEGAGKRKEGSFACIT